MEFTFDINELLKYEITKITSSLIPPGFTGDRRKLWDTQSKLSSIINALGEASASAQGLSKPITTADRLKNSDHTLYLLMDPKGQKGKGSVMGLLKMGRKSLYIFDRDGEHHQLTPLCVLDFYVHEAMQRMGLGKKIFEHMLKDEHTEPVKLAIDRPSEKFLGFLKKHYDLTDAIPQMNNFVVFAGFFPENGEDSPSNHANNNHSSSNSTSPSKSNGYHSSPFGRYGAPRPTCSMGQIIHNHTTTVQPTEPNSEIQHHQPPPPLLHFQSPKLERPRSLSLHNTADEADHKENDKIEDADDDDDDEEHLIVEQIHNDTDSINLDVEVEKLTLNNIEPTVIQHRVKISERENNIIPADIPAEYTPRTPSNLTDQGFLDLKFYHSRLW